jgi:hypothetical protein
MKIILRILRKIWKMRMMNLIMLRFLMIL